MPFVFSAISVMALTVKLIANSLGSNSMANVCILRVCMTSVALGSVLPFLSVSSLTARNAMLFAHFTFNFIRFQDRSEFG